MSESVSIHVVRKSDLRQAYRPAGLEDPHAILNNDPERRATLLSNPLSPSDDDPAQVLACQGQRIIGRIDVLPGIIHLARPDGTRQDLRTLWGSSWYVPPEYRKTMAALMIIMKWQTLWPSSAVVGISQMALPIYEKLKWTNVPMTRSVMIVKSRPVVERYIGAGVLGSLARVGSDAALMVHALALNAWRSGAQRLTVAALDAAPPSWDEPLDVATKSASAGVARSSGWINWILHNNFSAQAAPRKGLFVVRDREGKDLGYFLIRDKHYEVATARAFRNLRLGSLSDWCIFAPERLTELDLVALACRELRRRNVDAVEVCSTNPLLHKSLRRVGFVGAGQLAFMFRSGPGGALAGAELARADSWRVRPADGDNFFA